MIDTSLLNANQREAVLSDDHYQRIIAGAGSGKTRVLTMRIAHLIEDEDVYPNKILAITFTNKAANEMKQRVMGMLDSNEGTPWISTIHSLCVRILREDIQVMGYPKNFAIMDADDQKSVVKEACRQLNIGDNGVTPAGYIDYISNNKSEDVSIDQAMTLAGNFGSDKDKARVYKYYLERQEQMKALDFDDLILWTVRMFTKYPDVLSKWQRRFHYILVDEFQDIDNLQYRLIRLLAGKESDVYVVGDPDQTIYTWRGANVDIIMHFEKDFPHARTIILNQNYRSTSNILNAANSVIANNSHRMKKDLFTENKGNEKVQHFAAPDDEMEASWIAGKIMELHHKGTKYSDIAVLYRSNYLSRSLEKGMIDNRIPYIIYGGIRFYERQEVKDILCYLRMCTSADDLAVQRVLNRPKRGIGARTIENISAESRDNGISMYEVLKEDRIFTGKSKKSIEDFVSMVEKWRKDIDQGISNEDLLNEIIKDSGYQAMLKEDKEKGEERMQNLKAVGDDMKQYFENNPDGSLDDYLQQVALYTDRDTEESADCVQMMTVHAAKGLEFDIVFVADMNDGIFPNQRAMDEGKRGLEEERRLAYVAFTRARKELFLTEAGGFSYVLQDVRRTSRFIKEIDPRYIEHLNQGYRSHQAESEHSFHTENVPSFHQKLKHTRAAGFNKGDQVVHAVFGEGIVISCDRGIAQIAFPYPYGIKKIAAGHPSLKKKEA